MRNLQKMYLQRLLQQTFLNDEASQIMIGTYKFGSSDLGGIFRAELLAMQDLITQCLKNGRLNKETQLHLKAMQSMIAGKFAAEKKRYMEIAY